MKKLYRRYMDDEISSPEDELLKLRQQRLEQAALRLEQRERHIKLQEEKTRLLEEKRHAEEIERRKKKFRKALILFIKGVGSVVAVGTSIVGLLSYLRQEAQYSPEAARAYRSIITILEQMLAVVKHGGSLAKRSFLEVADKLSKAVKYVWESAKQRFAKAAARANKDSAIIIKYIKKDAAIKCGSAKRMKMDSSIYSFNRYDAIASKYVNRAIRMYDRKYSDIFPLALPAAAMTIKTTVLPVLIPLLKAGVVTGIGGAISGTLKDNILNPILKRIIESLKAVAAYKGEDETYLQALGNKISADMEKLIGILKKEKAFVANKLEAIWNRIKGLFKKK